MEYLRFILYGLIQGLTEFIPVSSTAHLKVISLIFGIDDPGPSLSAIIQLGSVFAIVWYFRKTFFNLKGQLVKNLISKFGQKGDYEIKWDGTNDFGQKVGSGVYVCKLRTLNGTIDNKMILLK